MKNDYNYIGNLLGAVFSAVQTNEVLSWISWGITLVATLLSVSFTIYKWVIKAKEDGKVDAKELQELGDIIEESTKEIKEVTKK